MAAHAIFYVKYDDGVQDNYPVWEHVYLVDAMDFDVAMVEGDKIARKDCSIISEMTCEGRPAHLTFIGIRKVIRIEPDANRIEHGTELTYSQFEVESEEHLRQLAAGESVAVKYEE